MTGRSCNISEECAFIDEEGEAIGFAVCIDDKTCDCPSEFGWVGEFCTEESTQVIFMRFILISLPILFLILLLVTLYHVWLTARISLEATQRNTADSFSRQRKLRRNIFFILGLTSVGAFLFSLAHFGGIRSTFDPAFFEYGEDSFVSEARDSAVLNPKDDELFRFFEVLGIQFISFGTYATMTLLIELLKGVMYFSKDKKRIKFLVRMKTFIDYLIRINIILIVILLIAEQIDIIYGISLLNTITLVSLFIIGRIYLGRIFKEFKTKPDLIAGVFRLIRHQLTGYLLSFLCLGLSIVAGRDSGENGISLGTFFYQLIFFLLAWLATANILYCRQAIANLRSQASTTNSLATGTD